MSNLPHPVVTPSAYLTLHYRLASSDGVEMISTFIENPATLQLGQGQLAPFLEACLMGLPEGDENSPPDAEYKIGDLVNFTAPSGGRFAGVLREIDAHGALFDFNHPLAGQSVRFEVNIIGIL
jgi:FKBP-type peptidyl-prolyl cis-trans isomerase SlpA